MKSVYFSKNLGFASIMVLMSMLGRGDAQAMQEEEKENIPYAQHSIPANLAKILTPLEKTHFTPPIIFKDLQEETSLILPIEDLEKVLSFLDGPSTFRARQVCKLWRALSIDETKWLLQQWQPGDESLQLVGKFIANPSDIVFLHQILAPKTPAHPVIYKCWGNSFFQNDPSLINVGQTIPHPHIVPQIVHDLALVIKDSPHLHSFLCRYYLNHIDVLDIRATSLAAYITQHVPEIQSVLQNVQKNTTVAIPLEIFPDLNNHTRLHQHLMALRLLALSSSITDWYTQNHNLDLFINFFLRPNIEGQPVWYRKDEGPVVDAHLIGHPFWGMYGFTASSFFMQLNSISMGCYGDNLNPGTLKTLWKYSYSLDPELGNIWKPDYLKVLFKTCIKRGEMDYSLPKEQKHPENHPYIAEAQHSIGILYYDGTDVPQNNKEALKWFEEAEKNNHPEAKKNIAETQYHIGREYFEKENYLESLTWLKKAYKNGLIAAAHNIGIVFWEELISTENSAKALKWFERAAENTDSTWQETTATAQNVLGTMYSSGEEIPQNFPKALEYFEKAFANGYHEARDNLRELQCILGCKNYQKKNFSQALKLFKEAGENGDLDAQYNVGIMYRDGQGIAQSDTEARQWLLRAAEGGHAEAQYNLAMTYCKGQYGQENRHSLQNLREALKWVEKAQKNGHSHAGNSILEIQYNIGVIYYQTGDFSKAKEWYELGVTMNCPLAQFNLGVMYYKGQGVPQNLDTAKKLFRKAASQGHKGAKAALEKLTNT